MLTNLLGLKWLRLTLVVDITIYNHLLNWHLLLLVEVIAGIFRVRLPSHWQFSIT